MACKENVVPRAGVVSPVQLPAYVLLRYTRNDKGREKKKSFREWNPPAWVQLPRRKPSPPGTTN
jgi:hypothetical protein